MKRLPKPRSWIAAAAFALAFPASASTTSVDYTDLWYIPAESGWGLNLIQQSNVLFATLFVYGTDNTPRWYVASDVESTNGVNFTGVLYRTTGPYFGATWNANAVPVAVGSISIVFNTPTTATVTYVADGVTVTKVVQRQTWRNENLAGNYLGGLTANATSCSNGNGPILIFGSPVVVTHNASNQAASIVVNFTTSSGAASVCTFNGTYTQAGKQGNIAGSWSCNLGGTPYNNGTFTMSELQATIRGFNARFQGSDQFCQYAGNFGVVRDLQ